MLRKKIIILGCDGFIGKNLKNYFNDLKNKNYEYIFLTRENIDLTNKVNLKNYMNFERPDIIINAAGNIGSSIMNEEKNDYIIFKENATILMNLLECCEGLNVEKLILFSTYRLFGDKIRPNYNESDIAKGFIKKNRGYLESKRLQNVLMELWMKEYSMKIICFVMTNVFGEQDQYIPNGKILSSLITKIENAKKNEVSLYIDTFYQNQVNLIYVKDIVRMVSISIESEKDCWNELIGNVLIFNPQGTMEIGELAKKIAERMDYQGIIQFNDVIEYETTNIMKPNLEKMELLFPDFTFTNIEEAFCKMIEKT